MNKISVIGISIGGTKTAVTHAFYDGCFNNIEKKVFSSSPSDPNKEMNDIYKAIKEKFATFAASISKSDILEIMYL